MMRAMSHAKKRTHEWIDSRSLELAKAVAREIRRDPSHVQRAMETLQRWKIQRDFSPRALEEWETLLAESSLEELLALLVEDSEEGRRRRQSSPFTGVLSEQERRRIFAKYEEIGA
jgi:hypothetical protein